MISYEKRSEKRVNLNCCGLMGILETSWNPWWSARFINDGGESCLMMLMELSWLAIGNSRLAVLHYELIFVFLALANFQTIFRPFWHMLTISYHVHPFPSFSSHFRTAFSEGSPSAKDASGLRIRCLHSCATTVPVDAGECHWWTLGALEYPLVI